MRAEARQREILSLVERRGYMPIDGLATHFHVTPQTIRRDINTLCDRKLLARQHGGASLPSSVVNTSYSVRHVEQAAEKERIARALVAHLPDHASLFVSLGTTVEAVAHALAARTGLKVVTNNPEVARILCATTESDVVLTGGTVQRRNGGLVGERTLGVVASLRCDFAVLGIGAIEPDGALLDYHGAEAAVMRAMMANARHTVVVADHTKFSRAANEHVAHLTSLAALVTDHPVPDHVAAMLKDGEVEILVATETAQASSGQRLGTRRRGIRRSVLP